MDTTRYVEETSAVSSADTSLVTSAASEYSTTVDDEQYEQPRNTAAPSLAQWDSLTADKEFGYKDEREFTPAEHKEFTPPEIPAWVRAISAFLRFFTTTAGLIILWSALALLIGFIAYRLISGEGGFFTKKPRVIKTEEASGDLSSEDLLQGSWDEKLHAAMQAGDYRLAIRYGYLLMLQLLQRRELIIYKQDKTNNDYYRELANTRESLRPNFRTMTRAYEWAWYGGSATTQAEAEVYFHTFKGLKSAIQ